MQCNYCELKIKFAISTLRFDGTHQLTCSKSALRMITNVEFPMIRSLPKRKLTVTNRTRSEKLSHFETQPRYLIAKIYISNNDIYSFIINPTLIYQCDIP